MEMITIITLVTELTCHTRHSTPSLRLTTAFLLQITVSALVPGRAILAKKIPMRAASRRMPKSDWKPWTKMEIQH